MKERGLLAVFIVMFILSVSMILIENTRTRITGYQTEGSTVSNVTISRYLAVEWSINLSDGIFFGTIDELGVDNYNASHNYDGVGDASTLSLNVSLDSNTAVDFCVRANTDLTDSISADIIPLIEESYANSTALTDIDNPNLADETSLTTTYVKVGENTGVGNATYYRFWLDAPLGQAAGTYNNTIYFKGVATTLAC